MTLLVFYFFVALAVFTFKTYQLFHRNQWLQKHGKISDLGKPLVISILWFPAMLYLAYAFLKWKK